MATSRLQGITEDQPDVRHAAKLGEPGEYLAVCDGRRLIPVPGDFDPGAPNACPACREA